MVLYNYYFSTVGKYQDRLEDQGRKRDEDIKRLRDMLGEVQEALVELKKGQTVNINIKVDK